MKKWYKSKTINFNALYLAVVAAVTEGFGVQIDPAVIAAVQTLMNFVLRKVTKEPIE